MLVLAALSLAFAVMGYRSTTVLFPDLVGTGLSPDSPLLVHASREFSARNLAIGLALLVVARVGVPESIAIVAIIRALIELQTVILGLSAGASVATLALPAGLLQLEVAIVRTLFGVVGRLESLERR